MELCGCGGNIRVVHGAEQDVRKAEMKTKKPRSVKDWVLGIVWFFVMFVCITLGFLALAEPHREGTFRVSLLVWGGFMAIAVLIRSTCLRDWGRRAEKRPVASALGMFGLSAFFAVLLWIAEIVRDAG